MKDLPSVKKDLSEDTLELSYRFIKMGFKENRDPHGGQWATCTQHVSDAIQRGTISPMEGYEIEEFYKQYDYFPEYVYVRKSAYIHLIR